MLVGRNYKGTNAPDYALPAVAGTLQPRRSREALQLRVRDSLREKDPAFPNITFLGNPERYLLLARNPSHPADHTAQYAVTLTDALEAARNAATSWDKPYEILDLGVEDDDSDSELSVVGSHVITYRCTIARNGRHGRAVRDPLVWRDRLYLAGDLHPSVNLPIDPATFLGERLGRYVALLDGTLGGGYEFAPTLSALRTMLAGYADTLDVRLVGVYDLGAPEGLRPLCLQWQATASDLLPFVVEDAFVA